MAQPGLFKYGFHHLHDGFQVQPSRMAAADDEIDPAQDPLIVFFGAVQSIQGIQDLSFFDIIVSFLMASVSGLKK